MVRYMVRCGECHGDDLHFPEPDEKTGEDGGNLTCSDPECGHDGLHNYEETDYISDKWTKQDDYVIEALIRNHLPSHPFEMMVRKIYAWNVTIPEFFKGV